MSIAQLVLNGALCWAFVVGVSDKHTLWVSCSHCVDRAGEVQVDSLKGVVVWRVYRPREGVDICLIRTGRRFDHLAFEVDRSHGLSSLWVEYPARSGKSGLPLVGKDVRKAHGVLCWQQGLNRAGFTSLAHLPDDLSAFLDAGKPDTALQGREKPPAIVPRLFRKSDTALQGSGETPPTPSLDVGKSDTALQDRIDAPPAPPGRICDPATGICVPSVEQERTFEPFPVGAARAGPIEYRCR